MSDKHQATIDALNKAAHDAPVELLRELGLSMASFIAEIDSSSSNVAAYITQRLEPLVNLCRTDIRVRDAIMLIGQDGRKLRKK